MPHRVAPQAEADLDDIFDYVARESGGIEIADRLIDSITRRFFLLARYPHIGRSRDDELRPGLRSFACGRIRHHLSSSKQRCAHSPSAAGEKRHSGLIKVARRAFHAFAGAAHVLQ